MKTSEIVSPLTLDDLKAIAQGASLVTLQHFLQPFNQGFKRFDLCTKERRIHFLAQAIYESNELTYLEALDSQERYKGRGVFKIEGKDDYSKVSAALGVNILSQPDLLSRLPDCLDSAFWFWNYHGLSSFADEDRFDKICLAVSGSWSANPLKKTYLERAKARL